MVNKPFGLRVPIQDAAGLQGDIGQQRGRGAAVADLDVAIAFGAALNAVQKIACMRCRVCGRFPAVLLGADSWLRVLAILRVLRSLQGRTSWKLVFGNSIWHNFVTVAE